MSDFDPQNPPLPAPEDRLADLRARPDIVWVPRPPRRRYRLHAALLLLTVLTTLMAGARLQFNFDHAQPAFSSDTDVFPQLWALRHPSRLLLGLPFALTLLLILLAHEMGHFLYCVRHRVYATLPFFLPSPFPLGTFGAVIRIRSPIPSRKALFDIGIAGPIAGFVLAVPALAIGMALSRVSPLLVGTSDLFFGDFLLFRLLRPLVPHGANASLADVYLHPVAIAAWIGMLATALNLIPGGQLDGGHIVYALFPRAHRWVSWLSVLGLAGLSRFWPAWLMWSAILLVTGTRHPPVPLESGLGVSRKLLAVVALVIFLLTFMPAPIPGHSFQEIRQLFHGQ